MKKKTIWLSAPILLTSTVTAIATHLITTSLNNEDFETVTRSGTFNNVNNFQVFNKSLLNVNDGIVHFKAKGLKLKLGIRI